MQACACAFTVECALSRTPRAPSFLPPLPPSLPPHPSIFRADPSSLGPSSPFTGPLQSPTISPSSFCHATPRRRRRRARARCFGIYALAFLSRHTACCCFVFHSTAWCHTVVSNARVHFFRDANAPRRSPLRFNTGSFSKYFLIRRSSRITISSTYVAHSDVSR